MGKKSSRKYCLMTIVRYHIMKLLEVPWHLVRTSLMITMLERFPHVLR